MHNSKKCFTVDETKYLSLLSRSFPTILSATTEIINLEAILNLPKGTEHFLSDIHGEFEAFQHVLKNGSGVVKRKVNEIFGNTLREWEKRELCTLIYYPREKLNHIKRTEENINEWYLIALNFLIKVCQSASSKYTRSKVRKALPKEYSYIIQEMLHESSSESNKYEYLNVIINTIISTGSAENFIIAMCNLIQQLVIDQLHIVGDIYDRGPGAHIIMDTLCNYHNFDIQWGNHDILWMGAAAGNRACMANALRICMRYGNLNTLEDGYAINLMPLARFAMEVYANDPCTLFSPKLKFADDAYDEKTALLIAQMHKAISIIQFKLEAAIIKRIPEFGMKDRLLLDKINFDKGTVIVDGVEYSMLDMNLPTIDPKDPYKLTAEEHDVVEKMHHYFVASEKLKKHMHCLYSNGGMYTVCNSNVMYHGSIPLTPEGEFKELSILGEKFKGRGLLNKIDSLLRTAYLGRDDNKNKEFAKDFVWYLWCGQNSPLFDKSKMATFERYFIAEKETHHEEKGYYFKIVDNAEVCNRILNEFDVHSEFGHVINGHVPVKIKKGENPIKAGGKLLVIDGGFAKAYQSETGIAGYTLIYHSRGFQLVQHEPFESAQAAIETGEDIKSTQVLLELSHNRMMVRDTDKGKELQGQINDLKKLLAAYRNGVLKEKS